MQEAHCPPRSKYSLCCSVRGGGVPSPRSGGGYLVPGPGGTWSQDGGTPSQVQGIPHPRSGGVPHPRSGGIPHPRSRGSGYPLPRPGMGYPTPPPRPDLGYPPTWTWDGVPPLPGPGMGYPPT